MKIQPLLTFLLFFTICQTFASDLDKPYCPTRKEWLELRIFQTIKIRTDVWSQRIGFLVWVNEKDGITVTLSSANRQDPLDDSSKKEYIKMVKKDIEELIKQLDWAKGLKILVQYN